MTVVGEVNASTIAMEEDKREEENNEKFKDFDFEKLKSDITGFQALAGQGKLDAALEGILAAEKQCRLNENITGTKLCCSAVLELCFKGNHWKLLNEHILLLAKRRAQMKQVVQAFVRQAMGYLDAVPDQDTKVDLMKTLQAVTEGKIYVEIERARLTRRLAAIKESEGDVAAAASILQEVAVETFGAMAKTEKIAFILDQVRLCLDNEDYIRGHILAKKISANAFVQRKGEGKGEIGIEGTAIEAPEAGVPTLAELKIKYYELMIRYHNQQDNFLEMCRCCRALYESEGIKDDATRWIPILKQIVWYVVLAPPHSTKDGSGSDHKTLLAATLADPNLERVLVDDAPIYKDLLTAFSTQEIMRWSTLLEDYQSEMAAQTAVFGGPKGEKRHAVFRQRATEHNVLVLAQYYSRLSLSRLATLLDMEAKEAEAKLAEMVVAGAVSAKIDRPAGVVAFHKSLRAEEVLNKWAGNISKLLGLVEKSCQSIAKESMHHKVSIKGV